MVGLAAKATAIATALLFASSAFAEEENQKFGAG
jgi:hypothetical protein